MMDVSVKLKSQDRWDIPSPGTCRKVSSDDKRGVYKIDDLIRSEGKPIHETWCGTVRDLMLHGC